jgi:MerR family transcriptional regulator, redox-sensitive transcriptional activator SoxR
MECTGSSYLEVKARRDFYAIMEELIISQVAERAGIRASTIRYYESINLLPQPRRVSGQRRYDAKIVDQLTFIQAAQRLGFTLAEIQLLFQNGEVETPMSERWQTLARQKLTEVDVLLTHATKVKQLLTRGLDCGCNTLIDCMNCVLQNCYEPQTSK